MKKLLPIFFIALLLTSNFGFGQNEIIVNVGDNLLEKVANASSGDVLLIQPGSHKASYTQIDVDKSLTFKGVGDKKPVVYIKQIDVAGTGIDLHFENLVFSGFVYDSISGDIDYEAELRGDYFLNFTTNLTSAGTISIEDCRLRNFNRAIIRGDRAPHDVENLIVNNSIISDQRDYFGNNYGPFRFNSQIRLKNIMITNTTIYDTQKGILQCENMPASFPEFVLLDHVTLDQIGSQTRFIFDFKLADGMVFIISNSIIGKTNPPIVPGESVRGFRFFAEETSSTIKSVIASAISPEFNVTEGFNQIEWSEYLFNEVMDPQFHDPENGNFMISAGSPLMQMSTEGTLIGDPRWHPDVATSNNTVRNTTPMNVYPNPASHRLMIELSDDATISIYSILGAKVLETRLVAGYNRLDIQSLHPGIYIVANKTANEFIKIVKQ